MGKCETRCNPFLLKFGEAPSKQTHLGHPHAEPRFFNLAKFYKGASPKESNNPEIGPPLINQGLIKQVLYNRGKKNYYYFVAHPTPGSWTRFQQAFRIPLGFDPSHQAPNRISQASRRAQQRRLVLRAEAPRLLRGLGDRGAPKVTPWRRAEPPKNVPVAYTTFWTAKKVFLWFAQHGFPFQGLVV